MGSRRWQVAQWLAGLAIVGFVVRAVVRNWDQVVSARLAWDLSLPHLLGGVALTLAAFGLLSEAWRRMVAGWGYRLPWWPAVRIWLLSSMAKYVPGKVWALAGLTVMAQRRGVPAWAATGSALLLQLLSLGTGALVVGLSGLALLEARGLGTAALLSVAAGSVALTAFVLWPPMLRRLVARFVPGADLQHVPSLGTVGLGVGANLLAWLGYGTALWLFAAGTLPEAGLGLGEAIGASTAAYVVGVLAPFAPGGLGVREGVLVLVLQERTGLAAALAIAAVARLGATVAEVGASVPFLLRPGDPGR